MASVQWAERIGRRLKLRDLHVLFAVAETGSMAKAANRLAVSQPVVSQAIADLEHTLGVRLVDRQRRGIEPTIYGRALLKHGVAAFDSLRQGVKEIEFLADPTVGELRIGCPEWIAAGLVGAIVDRLGLRYPRLMFHVSQTVPATSEFRELRQRSIDLVVGRTAVPFEGADLEADILYQEELCVVASTGSQWARRRKIQLAELVDEPWVLLPPNELPGSLVTEAFRASGLKPPQPRLASYSFHLRSRLLATGRYLSVIPRSYLKFAEHRVPLKVLSVRLPIEPRPVAVITLKDRTISPVAQVFIQCARELTKNLADPSSAPHRPPAPR
jgi:DNA-binding transcriptional LysR family regulator